MMAWIESHQELDDHPKTRKAAALLGISIPTVVGHLHIFWHWALSYAQDGDLTDYDVADIAAAARWEGDPETFVTALESCGIGKHAGFLERQDGRLLIHDWYEYAGKLIERRRMDAIRKRGERTDAVQRMSSGHPTEGARTVPTVPYRTVPNPTEPNRTVPTVPNRTEPITAAGAAPSPLMPLTEGQQYVLHALGAKRFRNETQRQKTAELESHFGLARWKEGVDWAATKGMALGDAISNLERALPKWNQPRAPAVGRNGGGLSPGMEAARLEMERIEREATHGN